MDGQKRLFFQTFTSVSNFSYESHSMINNILILLAPFLDHIQILNIYASQSNCSQHAIKKWRRSNI